MQITFIALVLDSDLGRIEIFKRNKAILPELKLFRSVNGFNIMETQKNLEQELGLDFNSLAPPGLLKNPEELKNHKPKWGTLACWLTKYKVLKWQVTQKIPYMCFIEDDLLLNKGFKEHCYNIAQNLDNGDVNIIRLGKWGEGYISTYESAKKILYNLYSSGILMPIDDQLRVNEIEYFDSNVSVPWLLGVSSGAGPRARTNFINIDSLMSSLN